MEQTRERFKYEPVEGNETLVEISRMENGRKLSVTFETFSEEQIKLFQDLGRTRTNTNFDEDKPQVRSLVDNYIFA